MSTIISKTIFTSKLFWLGFVQIGTGVLDLIKTNILESETAAWGAVASGIVTIVFRWFTHRPATLRGGESVSVDPPKKL